MSLANATNWAIWSTGSANNGGGFNPANANFATDGVIAGGTGNSPTLTSASYTFVAGDVGAWVFFPASGTAIAGWYIIVSVAAGVATLNAAVGAAQILGAAGQTGYTGAAGAITGQQVGIAASYISNHPIGFNNTAGCNTAASPTGVTWGVDYSQQAAAIALTGLTSVGAGSLFISSSAGPNWVGNIINITGGTNFTTGRFEIVSVSGTTATVDRADTTGIGAAGTGNLGGATAVLTTTFAVALPGNYFGIKATGTYTLAASWTITASVKGDTTNGRITVEGYTTIRGARDGRPVITSSTNNVVLITLNDNDYTEWIHLKMTHTAATRGGAFTCSTSVTSPVWFKDLVVGTIAGNDACLCFMAAPLNTSTYILEGVEVAGATSSISGISNNTGSGVGVSWYLYGCYIHDSIGSALKTGNGPMVVSIQDTIIARNAGGFDFSNNTTTTVVMTSHYATFVDNTADCLKLPNSSAIVNIELESNIAYNNNGWWINNAQAIMNTDQQYRTNRNNFLGSNSSGNYNGFTPGYGDVALSVNPFVASSSRNYALNGTAGGGALIRAAAFPVSWGGVPDTLNYRDGGAAQSQNTGGGSVTNIISSPRRISVSNRITIRRPFYRIPSQKAFEPLFTIRRQYLRSPAPPARRVASAIVATMPVVVPLQRPIRQIQQRQVIIQRARIAALLQGPSVQTIVILRTPPRRITQELRVVRRDRVSGLSVASPVLVPLQKPSRQVQARQVPVYRNRIAALLQGPSIQTIVVLRTPPRRITQVLRSTPRSRVLISGSASSVSTVIIRTPTRYIIRNQPYRRNPGQSLFQSNSTTIQSILVTSPRKVR